MTIKVLTIDDDSSMTTLLGTVLRGNGMDVISCDTGEKGITIARSEKPDIILLDLLLPGTDGWHVCKILRTFTAAPIAILSCLDDPNVISSALDAGADDFLKKPISTPELIAHIKNLIRRYRVETIPTSMMREFVSTTRVSLSGNRY
ncbi:MAG: response regulator [Chloroflexota bacterium]